MGRGGNGVVRSGISTVRAAGGVLLKRATDPRRFRVVIEGTTDGTTYSMRVAAEPGSEVSVLELQALLLQAALSMARSSAQPTPGGGAPAASP